MGDYLFWKMQPLVIKQYTFIPAAEKNSFPGSDSTVLLGSPLICGAGGLNEKKSQPSES